MCNCTKLTLHYIPYLTALAVLHSGTTLVFDRWTLHVPRSTCSWWV